MKMAAGICTQQNVAKTLSAKTKGVNYDIPKNADMVKNADSKHCAPINIMNMRPRTQYNSIRA